MEENPGDQEILEPGESAPQESRYFFIADGHCERRSKSAEEIAEKVEAYGEEYDCKKLLMGGDMGGYKDIKKFLETSFEEKRNVKGNHDTWWPHHIKNNGIAEKLDLKEGEHYDEEKIEWQDKIYDMCLQHKPGDFDIKHSTKHKNGDADSWEYDILLYGHSHIPHDRVLADGTLAVCPGSIESNNKTEDKSLPDQSAYVIEVSEDKVSVLHLNYKVNHIEGKREYKQENGILRPSSEFSDLAS